MVQFTEAQRRRLTELQAGIDLQQLFQTAEERQQAFVEIERTAIENNRKKLEFYLHEQRRPLLSTLSETLAQRLTEMGFSQVTTPTLISRNSLEKMQIHTVNHLNDQVFWVGNNLCLRPMLAPGLYDMSTHLLRIFGEPLRIFEIGSCFRKESEGKTHLQEFTMLNLVEWGTPLAERRARLQELGAEIMEAAGIANWRFEEESSIIYGDGLDIVSENNIELASSSMGPHPLDEAWNLKCSWVGIGIGLERLLMVRQKSQGVHPYARSLTYLDGATLKIN